MQRYPVTYLSRRDAIRTVAGAAAAIAFMTAPFVAQAQPANATPLKIGMIGSGRIGGTLGSLWVKAGHPVMFSSRHPEESKDLVAGLG